MPLPLHEIPSIPGQTVDATGLLDPEMHAYYPEFVNYMFAILSEFVPVKRKVYMDKMPYLKIGAVPEATVVMPGWVGAPLWERLGAIAELGNAASHEEEGYPALTTRRILFSPDIEGRGDHIARIPVDQEDGASIPAPEEGKKMIVGEAVTAEIIARVLGKVANITDLIMMDPHSHLVTKHMKENIPNVMVLTAIPILAEYIRERGWDKGNTKVLIPDLGALARGELLANLLNLSYVRTDKWRPSHNVANVSLLGGDEEVDGFNLITLDDRADTVGTIATSAGVVKEKGAKEIHVFCTHGLFSGPAIARLEDAFRDGIITSLTVTNTLPTSQMVEFMGYRGHDAQVLDVRPIFAEAVRALVQRDNTSLISRFIFDPDPPEVVRDRLLAAPI